MNRFLLTFATTFIAVGAFAQGQQPEKSTGTPSASAVDHAATFKMVDKDEDKRISKTEASADGLDNAAFNQLDTNHDGWLDVEEYSKRLLPPSRR